MECSSVWNCKNRFGMTGNFNVPGARMPQEVEAGETKFYRKMIFQIYLSFLLFQAHGTSRWPLPIGGQMGGPCCGVSLEGIRQPLGASCVAGRFITRPQNSHNTRRGRLVSLSSLTVRCGNYHRPWKKRRQMSKNSIKPLLSFYGQSEKKRPLLCVDLTSRQRLLSWS